MAPSVEINCRNNPHLNLHTNEKLFHSSDIKVTNGQDKMKFDKSRGEVEEKTRTYRSEKPFSSRKEEAAAIRNKFPTKIPIIVDRFHKESHLPQLERSKFLVPQEITMSQFVTFIRNRMKLDSNQAFYLLVNNRSMLSLSKTLAEVYNDHKEEDGFLYMTYASEDVFGGRRLYECKREKKEGDGFFRFSQKKKNPDYK